MGLLLLGGDAAGVGNCSPPLLCLRSGPLALRDVRSVFTLLASVSRCLEAN